MELAKRSDSDRRSDALPRGLIFAVSFALLLPVAVIAAITGWRWQPWSPGARGYRPVLAEARLKASTLTAMVFSS